jgi:hypothetical protein
MHAGGHTHLIFEKEFHQLLEIRWHPPKNRRSTSVYSLFKRLEKKNSTIIEKPVPEKLFPLEKQYKILCYGRERTTGIEGGILFCRTCDKLILFYLGRKNRGYSDTLTCLCSLTCHSLQGKPQLWSFQGSDLLLSPTYTLRQFSFKPGFNCLSFKNKELILHCSRLSPADMRLESRSPAEILSVLSGLFLNEIENNQPELSWQGYRSPSIWRQFLSRLKRKKPFLRGKIMHDPANNIMFVMVAESTRPIPPELCVANHQYHETV